MEHKILILALQHWGAKKRVRVLLSKALLHCSKWCQHRQLSWGEFASYLRYHLSCYRIQWAPMVSGASECLCNNWQKITLAARTEGVRAMWNFAIGSDLMISHKIWLTSTIMLSKTEFFVPGFFRKNNYHTLISRHEHLGTDLWFFNEARGSCLGAGRCKVTFV